MSYFEIEASQHNIFLSFAINVFLSNKNGILLFTDGGLPFHSYCRDVSPILESYRPDAIIQSYDKIWIVEVKSYDDILSIHTAKQLRNIYTIMKKLKNVYLYLFIFDVRNRNVSIPELLVGFLEDKRLIINFTDFSIKDDQ